MKYIDKIKLKDKIFKIYKINKNEIYIFKKLHLKILENVDKRFDSPYDYNQFKKDFDNKSCVFLIYYKNKPIAYTLVYIFKNNCSFKKDFKKYCDISNKDINLTAELAGSGVLEGFRGYGLQNYFFELRYKYLKEIGFKYSVISVHPDNKYSLKNIYKNEYVLKSKVIRKTKSRLYFKKTIN